MYKIFVTINREFGEIDRVEESDRDTANIIWKDLMTMGCPIITVNENSFKIWNARQNHQPEKLKSSDWPEWATAEWKERKSDSYLGAKLIDWDSLGCFELRHTTMTDTGMKKLDRTFYTYRGIKMFSVTEYD